MSPLNMMMSGSGEQVNNLQQFMIKTNLERTTTLRNRNAMNQDIDSVEEEETINRAVSNANWKA